MPELILLAVVALSAMGLLVFLFLKLNKTQLRLIELLTSTNQSLLNQARSTELNSLATLNDLTGQSPPSSPSDEYLSTEDREIAAWQASLAQNHQPLGDEIYDADLIEMRSEL